MQLICKGNKQSLYSHPHQLSNLSQVSSSPTCVSKGTIDYSGGYDAWGNTTSQQRGSTTKSTAYDALDHLLHWSSTTNSQQEWYLYDASGERVLRRSFDGTNTTLTVYAFGIEEHQYAYSGSGSTATNTGNTYYYDLGGQLLGTWDGSSPTTTFLLTDSLGSVVSSFNNPSSGAVMQGNQLYGPYGNQRLKQGSLSTNKGFTGQYNDGLTGLDYYNARYYDPTIGLFLSADPMGGLDAYGYVGGNPESETDPSGLYRIWAAGPQGSPSTNDYPSVIPTVVSLFPPQPYHWQPASSFPSRPQPSLPHPTGGTNPVSNNVFINNPLNPRIGGSGSCGNLQALCGIFHANYALYTVGGASIGVPGAFCPSCGDLAGKDENVTNVNDEGLVSDEGPIGEACSFTSQTYVSTDKGKRPIGGLHVGEKVWAYNPKTRKMELQPILHVWINHDNDLVDLTITSMHAPHGKAGKIISEVIHTNKKHPFLTIEKGFLPVGQIKLGMHILRANGQEGVITGWKIVPGTKTMYNLEVAQDHTFTVGIGQWVVHNTGCSNARNLAWILLKWVNAKYQTENTTLAVATRSDGSSIVALNELTGDVGGEADPRAKALLEIISSNPALQRNVTYVGPTEFVAPGVLRMHAEEFLLETIHAEENLRGIGATQNACPMCRALIWLKMGGSNLEGFR